MRQRGDRFALTSLVLAEFIHIVSDPRRFPSPLTMPDALEKARGWWESAEVDRIAPSDDAIVWFLDVMKRHRLGRKRVLDTLLAAIYRSAGIASLLTLNATTFRYSGSSRALSRVLRPRDRRNRPGAKRIPPFPIRTPCPAD